MSFDITPMHDEDYHSYTVSTKDQDITRIVFDNIMPDRSGLWAELTVWYLFDEKEPAAPVIGYKRVNLIQPMRKDTLALLVASHKEWPWEEWIEGAQQETVRWHRRPPELKSLVATPDEGLTAPFLIEPFVLGRGVSLMFGPGGTGKSMLALAMGIAVSTGRPIFGRTPTEQGPVIYIDYEDTQRTHEMRLAAICNGMGVPVEEPDVRYLKPRSSLSKMRHELNQLKREHKPALIIVDSVGLARGGDASSSEDTIKLFSTLNGLDVAVLGIDHMNKEDRRSGKMVTPFGSVYTENSVRLAWAIRAAEASTDVDTYLNLVQTKRNNVAFHQPIGAQVHFTNEMVMFGDSEQPVLRAVNLTMSDRWWDQMAGGSTVDLIKQWMDDNTKGTITEIATDLSLNRDTVKKTVGRYEGQVFQKVTTGKPIVWGLL